MTKIEWGIVGAIIVLVGAILLITVVRGSAHQKCLQAGWPTATLDYTFTAYCVKRVDQTDVVKPLSEITGR